VEGGINVHPLQVQILSRACQLLLQCPPRDSGDRERIVYSTCSLNPIEDEAVIATILQRNPELRLVNVEHVLPGLRRQPGLTHWRVRTRGGDWFDTHEALMASVTHDPALQSHATRKYLPSMFPPKDATGLNLHYCFRLLPHHQDSGGFFVAVLERVPPSVNNNNVNVTAEPVTEAPVNDIPVTEVNITETPVNDIPVTESNITETPVTESPVNATPAPESHATEPQPKKQRQPKFGEPLSVLSETDLASEQWTKVKSFYGLRDDFPLRQLITRAQSGVSNRYYFVTARVRDLLQAQTHTFRVVHTGTKMFERADNQGPYCSLRICQEGAHLLYPYMTRRVITITWEDLCTLLMHRHPFFTQFSATVRAQLVDLLSGSCLFVLPPCEQTQHNRFVFAGWRGKNSCNLQMSSEEFKSLKSLLGIVDPAPVTDQSAANATTDQSAASVPNSATDQSAASTIETVATNEQ
jgi:tRNA (cytosine34-C5)-methyltransferase